MPRITGSKGAADRLNRLAGQQKVELVGRALMAGGEKIKAEASHLITQNSSGGHSGGKHQHIRSLPGHPPNEEFGDLRKGIFVEQPAPLRVLVVSSAPHARPLEDGTANMAARPSMGPAARAKRAEVVAMVNKAISAVTKKG